MLHTIELDQNYPRTHFYLGLCYAMMEKYDESLAEMQKARALFGNSSIVFEGQLGSIYARAGKRTEALKTLSALQDESKRLYVAPTSVAAIYAALGDKNKAFEWLEKAFEEREPGLPYLRNVPALAAVGLSSDPRFASLMRRVGLPQ